jgi:hypothetical protein
MLLTVCSNCLAGWWLGGGDRYQKLPFLLSGAALLFAGGTLWNDTYAVGLGAEESEKASASSHPGPFGAAQLWGLGLLILGVLALAWCGTVTAGVGLGLAVVVVVARVLHRSALSMMVPAVSRLLFYLIGASAGVVGIMGSPIWCGLVLAIYVMGVDYLPRQKNTVGPERHWPIVLLAVPIVLALIVHDNDSRQAALLLSAVSALWTVRCLRPALWSEERDFARAVSGLVAGIALVDLLAVAGAPRQISAIFITLFLMTRALQSVAAHRS